MSELEGGVHLWWKTSLQMHQSLRRYKRNVRIQSSDKTDYCCFSERNQDYSMIIRWLLVAYSLLIHFRVQLKLQGTIRWNFFSNCSCVSLNRVLFFKAFLKWFLLKTIWAYWSKRWIVTPPVLFRTTVTQIEISLIYFCQTSY